MIKQIREFHNIATDSGTSAENYAFFSPSLVYAARDIDNYTEL